MRNDSKDSGDLGTEPSAKAVSDASPAEDNKLSPLPGEAGIPHVATRRRGPVSKKGPLAAALLIGTALVFAAFMLQRCTTNGKKPDDADSKLASTKPSAATTEPRRLDMPTAQATSGAAPAPRIPALTPTSDEEAEPIGVRRTGTATGTTPAASGGAKVVLPEDAPVLLVTTRPGSLSPTGAPGRPATTSQPPADADLALDSSNPNESNDPLAATSRNLQGYQRQLQGLLDNLTQTAALANGQTNGQAPHQPIGQGAGQMPSNALLGRPPMIDSAPGVGQATGNGLLGGQFQGSATPKVAAHMLGNRSLTLPKGTVFTCALKTKVVSAVSGLVGCQVQRNVFSDDGRVLLIERGSHLDGEYRVVSVRPGTVRIPVLWTRIRTPLGVTVDIDSPSAGTLGESGIDGHVDNRWSERIGAAMLLSLIDDSVKLVIQHQSQDRQADTVVLPSTTANTSKLAEKVLDSTINIPPLIYQNQGGIVGIYVARDVDFSSVYALTVAAP